MHLLAFISKCNVWQCNGKFIQYVCLNPCVSPLFDIHKGKTYVDYHAKKCIIIHRSTAYYYDYYLQCIVLETFKNQSRYDQYF